ncbi:glycosyltransferase [Photobacterium leiognathi]|uniref:glycosyltransferase n=1 Tax=Photobacterium leiognathi TaxID=553611 RepID=UPI002981210D|nr:glycosyltransferase [Photobacterium leiognathi]
MNKVAFIITKSEIGGAQTWVRDQIKLLEKDIKPIVITNKPGWLSESLPDVAHYFLPEIESRFSFSALSKIVQHIKNNDIDIVVASSANAGLYSRLAKLLTKFHCIYVSHGWSCLYNGGFAKPVFCFIETMLSYLSDSILCVSQRDYDNAVTKLHISEKCLVFVRNAVFPSKVNDSNSLQKFDKLKLLAVGRLAHPKRFDLLVEVVQHLPFVELTVVGNGPNGESLRHKKYENINFVGEVKSFDDYHSFDAFILISDSEGLPMSALEAGVAQIPMILSDVGGCGELICKLNPNGILVLNDNQSISNAITNLFDNYTKFKHNATIKSKDFDINEFKPSYKKIYLS